jgi:hypothetical protein
MSLNNKKMQVIASIAMAANDIESEGETGLGENFLDILMQYCKSLGVTREELQQVLDTKLREILGRDI